MLADSNIVAQAVRAMRDAGHDVVYVGERTADPGDEALLAEAVAEGRIFVTKDHDIGVLVTATCARTAASCFWTIWATLRPRRP